MISRTVLLLAVVGLSCAATWQGYLPPKPKEHAHKIGCYIEEIDDVIPFGTVINPPGQCYRLECSRHMVYGASCGVIGKGPDCYYTKPDVSKPYPECCPSVKCIADNQVHKDSDQIDSNKI